ASFTGGAQIGAGTTDLRGATTINGSLDLDGGRVLRNDGTLALQSGAIDLGNNPYGPGTNGTINNTATGVFEFQGDESIYSDGPGPNTFSNAGTVRKSSGSGISYLQPAFTNTGKVSVQSGMLVFASFTNTNAAAGALSVAAGAALNFA